MDTSNYDILINKLDQFIRKYYKNQLIKGTIISFSLVLLLFVTATTLEYYGRFGTTTRAVMFWGGLLAVGGVLARWVVVPLLKLNKLGSVISHDQAASIVGTHFKDDVNDKLLNTLQLKRLSDSNGQSELLMAGIAQKIEELKPVPFTRAIDYSKNKKYLRFAVPPIAAVLLIVFTAPSIFSEGTERLVRHNEFFKAEAPFDFEVLNDNLQTVQQEDFELQLKLVGDEIPEVVYIQFEDSRFKMKKDDVVHFNYLFKNVQESTRFRFYADGFPSRDYELVALPSPTVLNFDVDLDYPDYVGKTDETLHNTGDLVVPAGTQIGWQFNTQNANKVTIRLADSTFALQGIDANTYGFKRGFYKNQSYAIAAENQYLRGRDSLLYVINVVPDRYPDIEVEERPDSLNKKRVYFRGSVKDDYGFSNLTFNYRFVESASDSLPERKKQKSLPISINRNSTVQDFFHFWDLQELGIQAGEEIEYYFEVWDNDGVTGAKSTRSQTKIFKAPTLEQISEQTEQNNDELKENMEDALKEARELQQELKKFEQKVLEKKELGWEDKNQMKKLLEKQKSLQQAVEGIQQQNQQNNQQQNEYTQQEERILQKQQQLQDLFNEVMTPEMKKLFEEMEKLMEEMNKEELQEKLDDMELSNKDIEKELDRTLELFKQMEFEQKMEENLDKLNELKDKQEDLKDRTEEGKEDEQKLKEEQDKLKEEFDKLKEELDKMEEMNSELEEPNEIPETEQMEEQIEQEMQESSDQLEQGKKKKSSQSQQSAQDQMEQMAQQMQQAMNQMQSGSDSEDLESLRQLLENLVTLSFDQEELMENTKGLGKKDPKYVALSQQQKKIKDDAAMIEDSLFALSKRVPAISATVNREISAINMNMEKTIDFMADRDNRNATNRQQLVMTSVNELALLLDEVVQAMQQQMANQKFGKGACNKPGGKGMGKPSAKTTRQMQQQLNEQLEQMRKQMEQQGPKPGDSKNQQKGGQKMSESLSKMAAEQEAIRQQLQKLAEDSESQGGGKGDMKKLADMMEQTETDIVNKNITRETVRRQQEILTRLLEHEKAEREREMDNERESNEAQNQNFSNPADFFEYNRRKEKEVELLKTVPPSLKTFYKGKVNEYFNNF